MTWVLEGIREQEGDDSIVQRLASRVFLHLGLETRLMENASTGGIEVLGHPGRAGQRC